MKVKKRNWKKWFAAPFLAIVLLMSMNITVFAAESTETAAVETVVETEAGTEAAGDSGAPGVDLSRFGVPDNSDGLNDTLTSDLGTSTADTFIGYCKIAVIIAGIIAALITILTIVRALKRKGSKVLDILSGFVAALLVVVIAVSQWATSYYAAGINNVFTKVTKSGDSEVTTSESDWLSLVNEIAEEGMVLMKNDNNVLPLATNKVNLLGYCAYNPYYSGSGSSSVSASDAVTIVSSLESAGIEINPATADAYTITDAEDKGLGFSESSFTIDEVSIDKYKGDASFESMKEYSDTAIVVFGRSGGEGDDLTSYGVVDGTNYLQLNQNERDLLEQATDTFENVIVIINSGNAMETGFLEEYGVDACIWAGMPGPYGFEALGKILTGEVNPSGKLPDTWVYDNYSAPAMENYGNQEADNSDTYYVDYVEGIYVGYKWYETAYAEGAVITNTNTGVTYDYNDYDSIVAYPFGYGLSYTTFEQKIVGGSLTEGEELDQRSTYSLEVEVTNSGDTTGKDAVQIYVTSPYTDYDKENGVEKAAVSLCGAAKTGDIQPGESETVTIEISMQDIASYDLSHDNGDGTTGSYMLDDGDYIFTVGENAHTAYDTVTAQVAEQYFFSGDNKRDSDDQAAYNEFDDAARGIYLSRQDAFANYEEAMNSVSTSVESTAFEDDPAAYDPELDEIVTKTYTEGIDYAVDGDLTLIDMVGLDFDDPQWDELVSQLTLEELQSLVTDATYTSPAIESIGKSKTCDTDGALGISSMFNAELTGTAYPCIPLLAATFNTDLAYQMGLQVADQCHNFGITGWYAPAMDTHRTAFSGRNFEYYSEDGFLGGIMGAAEASGAREKGLIVYVKHFALNDQETNRGSGLHTYSNEQAIREIYLKPFEITIKNADVTAIMNSMNYIGDVYAACCSPLLIEVLRNEWGFNGKVLTDMASDTTCVNNALRNGTDAWLSIYALEVSADTDADIYYLQRTAHNILYMEANAVLSTAEIYDWHSYLNILCVELAVIAVVLAAGIAIRRRK